jgi:hypothetical protein
LDGHPPRELLDDVEWEQDLMTAVRQGRAQHGA